MALTPARFDDIIRFAVEREEDAARGYARMLAIAKAGSLKILLRELHDDELRHKDILLGIAGNGFAVSGADDIPDLKITDYLLEEPLGPETNLQDLLIFAAKKEKKAADLYADLVWRAGSEEEKKLFQFLVEQELSHKLRLEMEYEKQVLRED